MGESFLEFMKGMGIFIICAQSLVHFTAGKSYEKYIKVMIGMMILAQFVAPVRAVLADGSTEEMWEEVERFRIEMENAMGEAGAMAEEMDFTTSDEMLESLVPEETEQNQTIKVEKIEIKER